MTWATGHYRNGILLAPLTAELVVETLLGRQPDNPLLSACAPGRFIAAAGGEDLQPNEPRAAVGTAR